MAVACGVYGDVFLCCPFFPRGVLDEILNLIESVSEEFPSYSYMAVKEEGCAPLFICCAQETVDRLTPLFLWISDYLEKLSFLRGCLIRLN